MSKFIKVIKTTREQNSDCYVNADNIVYIHDLQDARKIRLLNGEDIITPMDIDYLLSMSQS